MLSDWGSLAHCPAVSRKGVRVDYVYHVQCRQLNATPSRLLLCEATVF